MDKLQIQIKLEKDEDAEVVKKILDAATDKFGLVDNTVTSRVPNALKSLMENIGTGFGLGARIAGQLILVDFNPRCGRTEKFNFVFDYVASELETHFEKSFSFATPQNHIKTENSLPLSGAGRKFNSQIFSKSPSA